MGLLSKYKIRGSAGFSHHVLLPLVAVLLVAGIGGYVMLKSSSAAACSSTTIARNSSNKTCVKSAQTYLKQRGYYKLSIDGKFGNGTYNAARNFQAAKGLCVDGIIGPQTWTSLIKNTKGTCGKKTTPIKPTTNSGSTSSPSTPTCSSGEILTTLTTGSQVCVKSSASSSVSSRDQS